jgi:site-specific DNA recombinase
MKAAAIYARVSTEEQVGNTSLRGQVDACREYAQQHGYLVTKEVQEDFSGARLDRPGLTEIRDMIAGGELQALVVYEADRLSRKLGHLLLLQEEFDRLGANLLFVSSQDDTSSPEGRMFFQMRGAFAEYEKTKITERFRLGKLRTAKQGRIIGNHFQPLGYKIVNGQYQVIEEEARIVRHIFEWVARDRMSLRQVGIKLTQMGALTKRGNTRWLPPQVKAILDNKTYAGTFYWNRHMAVSPNKRRRDTGPRKVEKSSHKLRDESEWIAIPCPAIVSEEMWEAAHRQLQLNKERSPRNAKRKYLLRGLVRCGLCGYGFYGRGRDKHHYYYCGGQFNTEIYRAWHSGQKCPAKAQRADRLEQRVWDYVKAQVIDEEKLFATFELRNAGIADDLRRDQGELESLYAAESRLVTERTKMLDLYAHDLIDRDVLQERLEIIRKRQEAIAETKAEVLTRIDRRRTATATTEALSEYCRMVREGMALAEASPGGSDHRREFLEMLETTIIINERELHISGIITGNLPLLESEGFGDTSESSQLRKNHTPLQV